MDRQYIRDTQVIERYLQGRLTAAEESAFEEAYLGDAELLKELETAELLQRGLKALEPAPGNEQPHYGSARTAAGSPRYALAASLVAGIALTSSSYLYLENRVLREGAAPPDTVAGARLVPLVAVRGDNAYVIEAATTGEWIVLLLDPGFTPYDRYRAAVVGRDTPASEELFSVDGLTPSYEGMLAVVVPNGRLTPGDYEIVLAGRMRDWPEARAFDDLGRTPVTVAAAR
jgi:hypothetical protein